MAHCAREIVKKRTRSMLCGRGSREFAFDADHEIAPPYPFVEIDLVALTGAKAEGDLFDSISANTIGNLGPYSELVQSAIRALPDGILSIGAFPGAGKTTMTATIDIFLCLLSKNFKILVISGQHAALDALNDKLTIARLLSVVTTINKQLGLDRSGRPVQLPLVLRVYRNDQAEVSDLVRIVESQYNCGPDPKRRNTLCELLLQLLDAGPHSLPTSSKSGLIELAAMIKSENKGSFRKLRRFVAGELTWAEANLTAGTENPKMTANNALENIVSHILPNINVLICTTATAARSTYSEFVQTADICQNEEAGATSCPQIFAGWRGIGQSLILSGDSAQFGPYTLDYLQRKCVFSQYLATSTLDMIKRGGYPVFQLNTQHRAIDGQFDPVYKAFYSNLESIESPHSQHPDKHPDAQRVEAAFVADFSRLQPSLAGRIVPMFIDVPGSVCEQVTTSRRNPKQNKAASYVVQKLINCDIQSSDIMVIAAYRAERIELCKMIPEDVLVTTADAVQG